MDVPLKDQTVPVSIHLNNLATGLCLALLLAAVSMIWDTHDMVIRMVATHGIETEVIKRRLDDHEKMIADVRRRCEQNRTQERD